MALEKPDSNMCGSRRDFNLASGTLGFLDVTCSLDAFLCEDGGGEHILYVRRIMSFFGHPLPHC